MAVDDFQHCMIRLDSIFLKYFLKRFLKLPDDIIPILTTGSTRDLSVVACDHVLDVDFKEGKGQCSSCGEIFRGPDLIEALAIELAACRSENGELRELLSRQIAKQLK